MVSDVWEWLGCHHCAPVHLSLSLPVRWGKRAAHNRAQIVYYIAENLELRHKEVAQRIADMTGYTLLYLL